MNLATSKRLIVFLIPPEEMVNGGILSIFSICKVSRDFKDVHHADVILATYPGTKSYHKNNLFDNDEMIYDFDDILKNKHLEYLLIHIPEYASYNVYNSLKKSRGYLKAITELRINILNQNILLMQKPHEVAQWFSLTPYVTQTTAHDRYSSQELADHYNLPTFHLSTFLDPGLYMKTPFNKKVNLILLSPDLVAQKEKVLSLIRNNLKDFKTLVVKDMRYEDYKRTISGAKYCITFGEGFDNYYVEGFFSGTITFAVYNEDFFPSKAFSKFANNYSSYEKMLENLTKDIKELGDKERYERIVDENCKEIEKLYSWSKYVENIGNFYKNKFTYTPSRFSAERLIGQVIHVNEKEIESKNKRINDLDNALEEYKEAVRQNEQMIANLSESISTLENSRSWKVTKPLRKASASVSKAKLKKNKSK